MTTSVIGAAQLPLTGVAYVMKAAAAQFREILRLDSRPARPRAESQPESPAAPDESARPNHIDVRA